MWNSFADTLRAELKFRKTNITELAKSLGVDKIYLYKAISKEHFSQKLMEKIADNLNMAVVYYGGSYFLTSANFDKKENETKENEK